MSPTSTQIKQAIRENDLLTVKEVAAYLRVSRVTVWRWCQQGIIPASRVGRSWRIGRDDLLCLLGRPQPLSLEVSHSNPVAGADCETQTLPVFISPVEVD